MCLIALLYSLCAFADIILKMSSSIEFCSVFINQLWQRIPQPHNTKKETPLGCWFSLVAGSATLIFFTRIIFTRILRLRSQNTKNILWMMQGSIFSLDPCIWPIFHEIFIFHQNLRILEEYFKAHFSNF